jgi:hypothetical protein
MEPIEILDESDYENALAYIDKNIKDCNSKILSHYGINKRNSIKDELKSGKLKMIIQDGFIRFKA